jgi:hypothetical protein
VSLDKSFFLNIIRKGRHYAKKSKTYEEEAQKYIQHSFKTN